MQLHLKDPAYTERLASFLRSLGQKPIIAGPASIELPPSEHANDVTRQEMKIYLRVWSVLYPDAEVAIQNDC